MGEGGRVQNSVRPKPLLWFRSNTETQIDRYFQANTETKFQGKNPVINIFHHQRAPKTKFFCQILNISRFFFKLTKIYVAPKSGKTWQKFDFEKKILKKKVSVSERKVLAPIPIPKLDLGFGSYTSSKDFEKLMSFMDKPRGCIDPMTAEFIT